MAIFDPRMGSGGGNVLTAISEPEGIKTIMNAIAADLLAANTEGAFGVTLRLTGARLPADYAWGGKGVLPAGSAEHLRAMLNDAADDIEDIRAAGVDFTVKHTKAKIPMDFLAGGMNMIKNGIADNGGVPTPGVGPDGRYDWILQPLNAIAQDIASIKSVNGLSFTPETTPIT